MRTHVRTVVGHAHRVVSTLRKRRILTRRKILISLVALNAFFLLSIAANALSIPNTYIGSVNVGLKTRTMIRSVLQKLYTRPINVTINGHTYELTYEHMGIYLDSDQAIRDIFVPNQTSVNAHSKAFMTATVKKRPMQVPLSFTQEFFDYVEKINDTGLNTPEVLSMNQQNKQVSLYAPKQRYMVNIALFQETLRNHFGNPEIPITVPLVEAPNALEDSVATTNAKLLSAYTNPLTIIVGLHGQNHFLTLSPQDLKRYTNANIHAERNDVSFVINADILRPDLESALAAFDKDFNTDAALIRVGNGITNALNTRYDGGPADSIKVGIDSGPNTNGLLAKKYIEVDISQQKMYTYNDGNLVKSYRVSTGRDYPTPTGTFTILNKAGLGFSSIYNVWMPFWMGFAYSKELHAYFGIHELPYFYSGSQKIQRPREFIGAPNTGGCVALDIGDAKEVYQFADIGTPVAIFQ